MLAMEIGVRNFVVRTLERFRPSTDHERPEEARTPQWSDSSPSVEEIAAFEGHASAGPLRMLGSPGGDAERCHSVDPDIKQGPHSPARDAIFEVLPIDSDPALAARSSQEDATYPRYTDGPSRTFEANDGSKDCLALFLNRDMVTNLNDIFSGSHKVERLEEKFENASRDADLARIFLDQSAVLLKGMDRPEQMITIKHDMREAERALEKASLQKERLEEDLWTEKHNLAYSRNRSEDMLKKIFSDSQLLNETNDMDQEQSDEELSNNNAIDNHSAVSSTSEETFLSVDALNRCATLEEIERSRQHLNSLQETFDGREEEYDRDLQEYQEAVDDGSCKLPQSEFDRIYITNIGSLTACLKAAELAHKDALSRARALGVIDNEFEQESDFVDQVDDGYRESHEADMAAGVDRFFIYSWMDTTAESEEWDDDPGLDPIDEWEVKSVDISDSISMVAEEPRRTKIDHWRESCAL